MIAGVARIVRDVGLAEELAQDALVAALEHWPAEGVPDNAGAWLMTTAKRRALDRLRLRALRARKHEEFGADLEALQAHVAPDFVDALAGTRHLERHVRGGQRLLGADDALRHGRFGHEEGARDLLRRQAAEQAQRERGAGVG